MRFWLTVAAFLILFGLAKRWGQGPERQAAALLLANLVLSILNIMLRGPVDFHITDPVLVLLDLATLLGFLTIALRANRMWPMMLSALQCLVMIAHFSVFTHRGWSQVYWGMMAFSQYLQLLVLAVGVITHHRRELRVGPYRSWRTELPV
jgi:hypothetical protein